MSSYDALLALLSSQVLIGIPIGFLFVVFFFAFTGSRRERRQKEIKDVRNRHFGKAKDGCAKTSMSEIEFQKLSNSSCDSNGWHGERVVH